ncbi:hypothetical protein B566_EDAN013909 [Ephemera danica]|nr:hypothetical protein B566_EDAN013909 [Ephemera danica]
MPNYVLQSIHSQYVCVLCEQQAQRKALGFRCPGHGVDDRATRWSLFSPVCRGKWVRVEANEDEDCPCDNGADYIFV